MKMTIDTDENFLCIQEQGKTRTLDLFCDESFKIISRQWLRVGWNQKHHYTFSWMGRPIIQLPEDMLRMQEVIYTLKPDVIIETGVAHGGSLIFYASLFEAMGKGHVVGVDIDIRPSNRRAIEEHALFHRVTLFEGSSVAADIVKSVGSLLKHDQTVLVILDSNHTYEHVLVELQAYSPMVSAGSYIVATDGLMSDLYDTPRGKPYWKNDNPLRAAQDFLAQNDSFVLQPPDWHFNESTLRSGLTHWPGAWLKKIRS